MFQCGSWYKNSVHHINTLQTKLNELLKRKHETLSELLILQQQLSNQEEEEQQQDAEHTEDQAVDQDGAKSPQQEHDYQLDHNTKHKVLRETEARIAVLLNAIKQLGLQLNPLTLTIQKDKMMSMNQVRCYHRWQCQLKRQQSALHLNAHPNPSTLSAIGVPNLTPPTSSRAPLPWPFPFSLSTSSASTQTETTNTNASRSTPVSVSGPWPSTDSDHMAVEHTAPVSAPPPPVNLDELQAHPTSLMTSLRSTECQDFTTAQHHGHGHNHNHNHHHAHTNFALNTQMMNDRLTALRYPYFANEEIEDLEDEFDDQYCTPPRVQSSMLNATKQQWSSELHGRYECALQLMQKRKQRRSRVPSLHRVFHVDPDLGAQERYKRNDAFKAHSLKEHVWVETIDEALQSYVEGDIIELAEGQHVVSGHYPIYGSLTIRGVSTSNWKTLIVNKEYSPYFIWCIGKKTRVQIENVLIRSRGSHLGIVRVSLRAQFIATNVLFHCNGLEGFNLEHESKLWLDRCVILNSVGAAIHVNTGCKCLLTQSKIVNCGEYDRHIIRGQGAIVIYGTDVNYAEHLVTFRVANCKLR